MYILNLLNKLDIFLLDRIYTPFSHWLHDEFGIRTSHTINACIFIILCNVFLMSDIGQIIAVMSACALFLGIELIARGRSLYKYKLGYINPRRYHDQSTRIINLILTLTFCILLHTVAEFTWWIPSTSYWYFAAVSERPPREKRSFSLATNEV